MKRRGLLRAFLVGLSPLWVPAAERGGIEVCTAYGLQVIPADLPSSGSRADKTKPKGDCPLCRIQASVLLVPSDGSLPTVGHGVAVSLLLAPARTIAGLFVGFDHFSRAPPALS